MKKSLEVEIEIPVTPNFIRYGQRKNLPIHEFTEEELREIGAQWTENLVKAARTTNRKANA